MYIDFLLNTFNENEDKTAIIWHDNEYSYNDLKNLYDKYYNLLNENGVSNKILAIDGDYSPVSTAILLAGIELGCILVPLSKSIENKKHRFKEIAEVEKTIKINDKDEIIIINENVKVNHPLLLNLRNLKHPGLIVFSSGTTGESKAAVHDILPLLEKFKVKRHAMRSLLFLMFDHLGGFNTLLYNLSNAGCSVIANSRNPEEICRLVDKFKIETLPVSPTFINLLLLSEAYKKYDFSSLNLMTYGTEPMPESTLQHIHSLFPNVRFLQTYGLSELGVMRSKSKASDSLWVKIGGEDFKIRVVDGLLEIKAKSAMLGYLNAPSPFTDDGWFKTGDEVLVDGEYIKILGRKSDLINVGGLKVFPAEIESVLLTMDGIDDVTVCGENSPLVGQIVKAKVKISTNESLAEFRKRMRNFCKGKLENYKIPQKVVLVNNFMSSSRFKKVRRD